MEKEIFFVFAVFLSRAYSQQLQCAVALRTRTSCGGGSEQQCLNRQCCYDSEALDGVPHCYFPGDQIPANSEWSLWSDCSVTCGRGTRMRTRECVYDNGRPAPSSACLGRSTETNPCIRGACPLIGGRQPAPASTVASSTSPVSTTEDPNCRDLLSTCGDFVQLCETNLNFGTTLRRFCRKSCNLCGLNANTTSVAATTTIPNPASTEPSKTATRYPPSVCLDEYPSTCDRVLEICTNPAYINDTRKFCRQTCNLCQACSDTRADCADIATQCFDPDVRTSCPVTCKACEDQTETVSIASTPATTFSSIVVSTLLTTTSAEELVTVLGATRSPQTNPNTPPSREIVSTNECVDRVSYCKDITPICNDDRHIATINKCLRTCNRCTTSAPPSNTAVQNRRVVSSMIEESGATTGGTNGRLISIRNGKDCKDDFKQCPRLTRICDQALGKEGLLIKDRCRYSCGMCSVKPVPVSRLVTKTISTTSSLPTTTTLSIPSSSPTMPASVSTTERTAQRGECDDISDSLCRRWVNTTFCNFPLLGVQCAKSCGSCGPDGKNPFITPPPPSTTRRPTTTKVTTTTVSTTTTQAPGCRDRYASVCQMFERDLTACDRAESLRSGCRKTCGLCRDGECRKHCWGENCSSHLENIEQLMT